MTYGNGPPTRRGSALTRQATSASKPKPATLTKYACPGRCGTRPGRWPATSPSSASSSAAAGRRDVQLAARSRCRYRPDDAQRDSGAERARSPPRRSSRPRRRRSRARPRRPPPRQLAAWPGLRRDRLPLRVVDPPSARSGRRHTPAARPLPAAGLTTTSARPAHRAVGSRSARRGGARRRPADTTPTRPSPYTAAPARRRTA